MVECNVSKIQAGDRLDINFYASFTFLCAQTKGATISSVSMMDLFCKCVVI